ncbi:protein of unknown function [Austwickia chelonae]|uniref:DUF4184 family protein n=1 Tax=Austwickia chelonae NBRC 105200 TaxID=1184607 RepID=K6VPU5_9MICO|nr:DUF4184 family protein [Austwickia chelonae]GAB78764.1 hypothetical protein AUCHE_16_01870 [Austwickia chelonae NBRC 105200]SEW35300.1 protein of unknown function [Austwickia chelonae]
MPVTFAHPAAVLPLSRSGLPLSALVVGSMVPDVPLFVGAERFYGFTHSVPGLLTVDLLVGVVLWWLWVAWLWPCLADAAPGVVRRRLPSVAPGRLMVSGQGAVGAGLAGRRWWVVPVAVVVGAATHALWDEFTHAGRWGSTHIPWLADSHGGLPGVSWAQYASGLFGLTACLVALVVAWRRRPVGELVARRHPRSPVILWVTPLAGVVGAAVAAGLWAHDLRSAVYLAITKGALSAVVVAVCVAVAVVRSMRVRGAGCASEG